MSNCGRQSWEEKELYRLRQSVRRLVGEWREKEKKQSEVADVYADRCNAAYATVFYRESDTFKCCADELSALIDGKDGTDG